MIPLLAISFCATTLLAAPADDDFNDSAFRRGVAAFEAGTYDVALGRLRIAAFGYVEDLPHYETAQAYIAIAAQRLNRTDEAKSALQRIVSAERIERHFASLQLSPALRGAIAEAAKALLAPSQAALLTMPPAEAQLLGRQLERAVARRRYYCESPSATRRNASHRFLSRCAARWASEPSSALESSCSAVCRRAPHMHRSWPCPSCRTRRC